MPEPIDWVGVMLSLPGRMQLAYYYGLEVGQSFRVDEVVAVAHRFACDYTPESFRHLLDGLASRGVLTREGDLYTVTPGAAEQISGEIVPILAISCHNHALNGRPTTGATRVADNANPGIDPVCGRCGGHRSKHYAGRDDGCNRLFCYTDTTGDWFSDKPDDGTLVELLEGERPDVYEKMIHLWRVRNGHEPSRPCPDQATELLPCPFCGQRAEIGLSIVVDCEVGITCAGCGASVTDYDGDEGKAMAAWNRRSR